MSLAPAELAAAAAAIQSALRSGDPSHLEILGWGELSTTVGWKETAIKPLPPFASAQRWESYRALYREYVDRLAERGVPLVASELQRVEAHDAFHGYCLQPRLAARSLGPHVLATMDPATARGHLEVIFGHVAAVVDARTGFDAQLANWALADGEWRYFDLTTPLLRDADGGDRLDARLFLAALPAPLRRPIEALALRGILDPYFSRRGVALDLLGNLHKERLAEHLEGALAIANARLGLDLTAVEVRRHYRADARLWSALLALRRFDRWLHRRLLRRPYPFLLPGQIAR